MVYGGLELDALIPANGVLDCLELEYGELASTIILFCLSVFV
jgi:hypothetical protein